MWNTFPLFFLLSKIRQCYSKLGNIFLMINFIVFDFAIFSDLNSNPNNLEILIARGF